MRKSLNTIERGQLGKLNPEEKNQASTVIPSEDPKCIECEVNPAVYICPDCRGDLFCEDCFKPIHSKGSRTTHKRISVERYMVVDLRDCSYINPESLIPSLKKDTRDLTRIAFILKKDEIQNVLKKQIEQILSTSPAESFTFEFNHDEEFFSKTISNLRNIQDLYVISHLNSNAIWDNHLPEWLKVSVTSGKTKAQHKHIKPHSSRNFLQKASYATLPPAKWSLFGNEENTYESLHKKQQFFRGGLSESSTHSNNYDSANSKNSKDDEERDVVETVECLRTVTKERQPVQPESDFELTNQKQRAYTEKSITNNDSDAKNHAPISCSTSTRLNESLPDNIENLWNTSFIDRSLNNSSFAGTNGPVVPIPIDDCQPFKGDDVKGCLGTSICIQNTLRSFAARGELMVPKKVFKEELYNELLKKNLVKNVAEFAKTMENAEAKKLFHITKRKFGDSEPISYISMHLESLSLEAIVWVMYSLRKDEMTPNEKVLLSRIKESYAMKLSQLTWQGILLYISSLCNELNLVQKGNLPTLKLIKTSESKEGGAVESFHIFFNEGEWNTNDQGYLDLSDEQLWEDFLEYIDDFFSERDDAKGNKSMEKSRRFSDKGKWSSSVENILTKSNTKKMVFYPPRSSSRAIPGGRYGAAQLIKCCGPEKLSKFSLGKLSLLVQEAIDRQILVYHKTLLIRSNNPQVNKSLTEKVKPQLTDVPLTPEKQAKLCQIKSAIEEIVKDNPNGIALARLPRILQSKLSFPFDCHEFGFSKLKHLLLSMDSLLIENPGTTYATAKLNKKAGIFRDASLPLVKTYFQSSNIKKNHSDNNLENYKEKVNSEIMKVLSEYTFPIDTSFLYEELKKRLYYEFDFTIFDSKSFDDYLHANLVNRVQIIKRGERSICFSTAQNQNFRIHNTQPPIAGPKAPVQIPYFTTAVPPGLSANDSLENKSFPSNGSSQFQPQTNSSSNSSRGMASYSGVYFFEQGIKDSDGNICSFNNASSNQINNNGNTSWTDSEKSLTFNLMKHLSDVSINNPNMSLQQGYYAIPTSKNLSASNSHSGGSLMKSSIPSVNSAPIQNLKYKSNNQKDKSCFPSSGQFFFQKEPANSNPLGMAPSNTQFASCFSVHAPDNFSDNFSQSHESLQTKTILNQSSVPFLNTSENFSSSNSSIKSAKYYEDSNLPDLKFIHELLEENPTSVNYDPQQPPSKAYDSLGRNPFFGFPKQQGQGQPTTGKKAFPETKPKMNVQQAPFQFPNGKNEDISYPDYQKYFSQRQRGQSDY